MKLDAEEERWRFLSFFFLFLSWIHLRVIGSIWNTYVSYVRTVRTITMFFTQRKCLLRISNFMQDETKR